jgi:hypothetical protein
MKPFLKTLLTDGGYQGPQFAKALAKVLPHLDVEIVKRFCGSGRSRSAQAPREPSSARVDTSLPPDELVQGPRIRLARRRVPHEP